MNPFVVNEENKKMVQKNINFMLRNFLANSNFTVIIFNWVIHQNEIFNAILAGLKDLEFELYKISLVCSPEELSRRMKNDGRDVNNITESLKRLAVYDKMDTIKINTTLDGPKDTVDKILEILA